MSVYLSKRPHRGEPTQNANTDSLGFFRYLDVHVDVEEAPFLHPEPGERLLVDNQGKALSRAPRQTKIAPPQSGWSTQEAALTFVNILLEKSGR